MRAAQLISILSLVLSIACLSACEVDSSDGELDDLSRAAEQFDSSTEWDSTTTPLACEMDIPAPPEGDTFDPTKVSITIEIDKLPSIDLPRVEDESECLGGDGWYYSPNNLEPKKIVLCPSTCDWVQKTEKIEIKLVFGYVAMADVL
jgi:hypothetical protein